MRHSAETGGMTGEKGAERRRVAAVVETLAALRNQGDSLAGVAHDARNMVTALGLYCDLLEEPGVLAAPFSHYSGELRLVAGASRRLVEKLVALEVRAGMESEIGPEWSGLGNGELAGEPILSAARVRSETGCRVPILAETVGNLAEELLASRNLLAALAGPAIALTVSIEGGRRPVRLTAVDLTRVLVNLVKNAAEAMPSGGRIEVGLSERKAAAGARLLVLTVEDNGSGIREGLLEKVFESGFTTRDRDLRPDGWPASHRGLGLAISRSILEAAGGRITASNREQGGARFEIELPASPV